MHRNTKLVLAGLVWAAWSVGARAGVTEALQTAANAASGVATKTERAVKRGVEAGISGVERGTKAAGRAVESGAKKIGIPGAGASSPKH